MKEVNFNDLTKLINERKQEVNAQLVEEFSKVTKRRIRTRTRSEGEQEALTKICINKWNRAIAEGKIKKIGEREYYYELD